MVRVDELESWMGEDSLFSVRRSWARETCNPEPHLAESRKRLRRIPNPRNADGLR